jgi:hypothetical protein
MASRKEEALRYLATPEGQAYREQIEKQIEKQDEKQVEQAFSAAAEKVRENRLRRMAKRQGLDLVKSRRRDPYATDYGTYGLVDPQTNSWASYAGSSGYGMSLDDIERALTEK